MERERTNPASTRAGAGLAGLDLNRFMFEVADEIRAGLKEEQQKTKSAGLDPSKPFDKQISPPDNNKSRA